MLVAAASDRESAAVAARAADWICLDSPRLKKNIHSLTATETARIPADRGEKATGSGWTILSREDWPSSTPTRRMSMATTSPARYSIRPWPKGCSSSAFWPARRKPTRVTTEEAASDRLLKASAVTAMEAVAMPAKSLPRKSSRFSPMPTAPDSVPPLPGLRGLGGSIPDAETEKSVHKVTSQSREIGAVRLLGRRLP
jgi:hypothetical protein